MGLHDFSFAHYSDAMSTSMSMSQHTGVKRRSLAEEHVKHRVDLLLAVRERRVSVAATLKHRPAAAPVERVSAQALSCYSAARQAVKTESRQ